MPEENNNQIEQTGVTNDERYNYLIEELKALILEAVRISREEIIRSKWELGKRIIQEEGNFERGVYGEKTIKNIARDLGTSVASLYKTLQFYRAYPKENFEDVMEELPFGNNCSWHKIVQHVLPTTREEREETTTEEEINTEDCGHTLVTCNKCKRVFTFEDFLNLSRKSEGEDNEKNNQE